MMCQLVRCGTKPLPVGRGHGSTVLQKRKANATGFDPEAVHRVIKKIATQARTIPAICVRETDSSRTKMPQAAVTTK